MKNCFHAVRTVAVLAGLQLGVSLAGAANTSWTTAGQAQWSNTASWSGGVPNNSSDVFINNSGTANLAAGTTGSYSTLKIGSTPGSMGTVRVVDGYLRGTNAYVGSGTGGVGRAVVNGGTWRSVQSLWIGQYGSGTLTLSGSGKVSTGDDVFVGVNGGRGTVTMTGGELQVQNNLSVGGDNLGSSGTGTFTMSSGTTEVWKQNYLGYSGGNGQATVSGGLFDARETSRIGAGGGTGVLTVSGGTYAVGTKFYIGGDIDSAGGTGTLNLNGGLVTVGTDVVVGSNSGTGTVTVNGGTMTTVFDLNVGGDLYGTSGTGTMNLSSGRVTVGQDAYIGVGSGTGTVSVSGGTMAVTGILNVGGDQYGTGGNGTLNVSGGAVNVSGDYHLVGYGTGATGEVNVSGSGRMTVTTAYVGSASGTGTLTVTGGRYTSMTNLNVGGEIGYGGTGTVNVSGGTLAVTETAYFGISTGTGTLNVSGSGRMTLGSDLFIGVDEGTGVASVTGGTVSVGQDAYVGANGASGTMTVNGGNVNVTRDLIVGGNIYSSSNLGGTGVLNISSGTVAVGGVVYSGFDSGEGAINLSGTAGNRGVLTASQLVSGTGVSTLKFTGGVLRATADQSDFVSGYQAITLGTRGAYIDSGTFSIGIATNISGGGQLTKQGTGTLRLSGSNSYDGNTNVNDGSLVADADGAFSSNSIFDVDSGAEIRLAGTTQIIAGLTGSGAVKLNSMGRLAVGLNNLDSTFAGQLTGNGQFAKVGSGTLTLSGTTNNYTGRTIVAEGALRASRNNVFSASSAVQMWSGAQLQLAGSTQTIGSLSGTGTVRLGTGGLLNLGGDNTSTTFAGEIVGDGSVTKQGTGDFTLSGANTYTGVTFVSGGTLTGGAVNAFSAASQLNIGNNAEVVLNGFSQTVASLTGSGRLRLTESGTLTTGGDNLDTTFDGRISGNGGLVKTGTGVMTLTGTNNTYRGTTTVDAGGLRAGASGVFSENSAVVVNSGAELILASSTQSIESLAGSGTVRLFNGQLAVAGNNTTTVFSGHMQGAGSFIKNGNGTLSLSGSNSYQGGTTINAGTLTTADKSALGSGGVTLGSAGQLELEAGTTLSVKSMDWADGGSIKLALGSGSEIKVRNLLTQSGTGTFAFTGSNILTHTEYDLITFDTAGSVLTDWTANLLSGIQATFSIRNDGATSTLRVSYNGQASGNIIDNSGFPFTPTNADFLVNGSVTTSDDVNTVNQLTFNPTSFLSVFNQLIVTSGNLIVGSGSATINGSGQLVAPNGLTKLGEGLLNVLNNILVTGPTNILQGTLAVNGTLTTQDLFVQLDAWLKGSGVIFGNVFNNGTVAPGNSPGTLTIMGNFTQSSSATLDLEIESLSNFDRLIVSGNASLAGTLNVISFNGFKPKYGQQFAFLQAGSISGDFDSIVMPNPSQFRGRFLAEDGVGTLVVAPTSYTLVAETQNQVNVARALDSFISATSGDRQTVSIALDLQTADQYPAAFEAIAPGFYESLTDTTIELAVAQSQMIAQRLSAVRLGVRGFSAVGIEAPLRNDRDGKSVMEAKGDKGCLFPTIDNKWGVWVQGNGIFGKTSSSNMLPNYRSQNGGFFVGADYAWNEGFTTGVFTGYQGTYSKYANGSSSSINSALFGGYATYTKGGFYSDAIITGGYNGYIAKRSIEFSTVNRTARANPNGGQLTTYLDAGYDWNVKGFTFGPLASVQYTYAGVAPFTETGADSLDLRVQQQNANSLRTNLGGRIAYTWNLTDKIVIIPEVRMFWQHEFLQNSVDIGASLDGGNGPGFDYATTVPDRDSIFAAAGVSAVFNKNFSGYVYYNSNFARSDYMSQMISTGLNWKF